jgi:molecular chaperone DnaJ
MANQDYYEILGITRKAKQREIEQAYVKLARKYHPDVNPGDEQMREKYQRIQEAYAVLGDAKKRAAYDRGSSGPSEAKASYAEASRRVVEVIFEGFDEALGDRTFEEAVSEILDIGGPEKAEQRPERGGDIEIALAMSFEQALTGFSSKVAVGRKETCPACRGTGAASAGPVLCPECNGQGRRPISRGRLRLSVPCKHCGGKGMALPACSVCGGSASGGRVPVSETLTVEVPAGVGTGSRIRVPGKGDAGVFGGPPGDLYLLANVGDHPFFDRKGDNVYCTVPITVAEAVLGGKIEVPTISGKATLRLPPGTQHGQVFRLREKGVRSLRGDARGDQYVEIRVEIPRLVDEKSKGLLREFERLNPQFPRKQLDEMQPLVAEPDEG